MEMRRETSRVSFLMCPFCVRAQLTDETTAAREKVRRLLAPGEAASEAVGRRAGEACGEPLAIDR